MADEADETGEEVARLAETDRTRLRRKRDRGTFDRAVATAILDEALVCHVGFIADHGPVVLPMTYGRVDDELYLHGAAANDMLRQLVRAPACVTVTLLDGLVFARSAFKHSMNYRSVVLFGQLRRVVDADEMQAASKAFLDHLAPGRSADARRPSDEELRATTILALPIREGSAKVRTGGPLDTAEDLDLPIWAGHVPFGLATGAAITDPSSMRRDVPTYLTNPGNRA
jgi:nitroimidazol reductase NimA-like FMN-containing flavoprotein (pyridoxamine 5'-phosphate oxidase superfamily)